MQVFKSKLNYSPDRDIYWAKLSLKLKDKDSDKKTSVLVCASYEYLGEKINLKGTDDTKINSWYETIVNEWEKKGKQIFRKQCHYDVRAITENGEKNGLKFLKKEFAR